MLGMFCVCLTVAAASASDLTELQKLLPTDSSTGLSSAVDQFTGANSRGPFILSWKPISRYSEQVFVNGHLMQRDQDYDIDSTSGMIAFRERVDSGRSISVQYSYAAATATKNTDGGRVPLSLDLVKSDTSGVRFLAVANNSGRTSGTLGVSTVGLSHVTRLRGGEISSMFLLSSGATDEEGSVFGSRSALRFGGSTEAGQLKLTGSYARVGEDFQEVKEYGLKQGSNVLDVGAAFSPSSALSLTSSLKRTESLMSDTKGHTVSTMSSGLVYAPKADSKLSFTRVETTTDTPGSDEVRTISDAVQLKQSIGSAVSATASYQNVLNNQADEENSTATSRLSVVVKPSSSLSVRSDIVQKDSSTEGAANSLDLQVDAAASKGLSISAAIVRKDSEVEGSSSKDSVTLKAAPGKDVSVQLDVARTDAESTGTSVSQGVKVSASPGKSVQVSGSYKARQQETEDAPDSMDVAVQIAPAKSVRFTGMFARNPENSSGTVELLNSRTVGLNTDFGSLKVKGAYSLKDQYLTGDRAEVMEVGLDLHLSGDCVLSSSYKMDEYTDGTSLQTSSYALTFTRKVGSTLNMSLSGKMTTCQGDTISVDDAREYKAEAKVGLRF